jgi:hypothetical protein
MANLNKCADLKGLRKLGDIKKEWKGEIFCSVCSKTFTSKYPLKQHFLTHDDVNMKREVVNEAVVCETCGKRF